MDKLSVVGGQPLTGTVKIDGAKNAALPILFACLLTEQPCRIANVPALRDISSALAVLRALGAEAERDGRALVVRAAAIHTCAAPYEFVRTMRASVLALGPLLARFGRASVALPGGCAIGSRPIDLHIKNLRKMGAEIRIENGNIIAHCRRLRGAALTLEKPSVTGTENLMMAAVLADGETTIENAAREPEIFDLAAFLSGMGARLDYEQGGATIRICGVSSLSGTSHRVMPDRIEAGTYLAAVAAAGGDVLLRGARAADMRTVLTTFAAGGVGISEEADGLRVTMRGRFAAVDAETAPYPGYPTDMQAQLVAVAAGGKGRAVVTETVFENRFMHVQELARMGANIELRNNTAIVTGAPKLNGAPVMATDLRASASLVVAALAADGKTDIRRIYHLDRGYQAMEKKLRRLGASVRRLKERG